MENKRSNRTLWIILAIVVVVLCCAAVAAALLAGVFAYRSTDFGGGRTLERIEQSFDVGPTPLLVVNSFAGNVTVRSHDQNSIQVTATKRARGQSALARIQVQIQPTDQGVEIKTDPASATLSNTSVEFDILVPAGTSVDIETGAGQVEVHGLTGTERVQTGAGEIILRDAVGEVDAHTGAGTVDLSGGTGRVRLDTGAGSIVFRGAPQGDYQFQSGVGSITIWLPADAGADLDLTTGFGNVTVDFAVQGQVTGREVKGTIGSGAQATIQAHTGTGSIEVKQY